MGFTVLKSKYKTYICHPRSGIQFSSYIAEKEMIVEFTLLFLWFRKYVHQMIQMYEGQLVYSRIINIWILNIKRKRSESVTMYAYLF